MDTQNPSAPSRAQSRNDGKNHPTRGARAKRHPGGVTHDNFRHTTRFTVIGNHLAQHPHLSLLAIGLACHIQSLPTGAPVSIKSLAARFPEGATRIADALRELETHGYLRRIRERTPTGRLVTRTVSCNQPGRRDALSGTGEAPNPRPAVRPPPRSRNRRAAVPSPPCRSPRAPPRTSSGRPPTSWPACAARTPPAALRHRRRTPRPRRRRLAGARPHPHRRTHNPGRRPAPGAPGPARCLPGPPPDGQTAAPPTVPRPRATRARPAPLAQLRHLRPRLSRPRPPPLPGLRLGGCRFRCPHTGTDEPTLVEQGRP
ncbi:hypothetical protein SHKM778_01180 [Streptomyces sp. KM77-8]|uniref:Helix-turn-helix domain-containing protein n=1 Tax=Streptomyces haneummycinicus TaxID=3074435 RepID=A0AAT9H8N9_9ACTN